MLQGAGGINEATERPDSHGALPETAFTVERKKPQGLQQSGNQPRFSQLSWLDSPIGRGALATLGSTRKYRPQYVWCVRVCIASLLTRLL